MSGEGDVGRRADHRRPVYGRSGSGGTQMNGNVVFRLFPYDRTSPLSTTTLRRSGGGFDQIDFERIVRRFDDRRHETFYHLRRIGRVTGFRLSAEKRKIIRFTLLSMMDNRMRRKKLYLQYISLNYIQLRDIIQSLKQICFFFL